MGIGVSRVEIVLFGTIIRQNRVNGVFINKIKENPPCQ